MSDDTTRSADGLRAELTALGDGAAVTAPGLRTAVRVSGPDHRAWLDRISSMPVASLEPGHCTWATLMDGKGKMRCDMRVADLGARDEQPALLIELPASHHAALLRVLDMYILRDKVELSDLSASHAFVSVLGPRAAAVLDATGLPAPEDDRVLEADGVHALASRLYGAPGADLLVPAAEVEALLSKLLAAGATRVGRGALDIARVRAGVPWFEADMADAVIPLEAGLDAHVSTTKGCYPGQEVVARIANLGQVTRRLVRLSTPDGTATARGAALVGTGQQDGKPAGTLTSIVHDPVADRGFALGYVRRAFWTEGTLVEAGEATFRVEGPARP